MAHVEKEISTIRIKKAVIKTSTKIAGMYFANIVKGKKMLQTSSRFKETKMT